MTLAGTVTAALLDASVTVAPPGSAAPLSVMESVAVAPPFTEVGFTVSAVIVGITAGVSVTVAVLETPP